MSISKIRLAAGFISVIILGACGAPASGGSAASTARASATASASPSTSAVPDAPASAVVVKDFLVYGGANYGVSIVDLKGRTLASATAAKRPRAGQTMVQISSISTSKTRLYYLDGASDVRFLAPDGSRGLATRISLEVNRAVAFAVSPDDQRIAVAVLDFNRYPVGTRLYVEDVNGGGNHVELFSSATTMEWPVGWHAGKLVVAMGVNVQPQNSGEFFMWGHGYHVIDATSGQRIVSVCDGIDSYFPPVPAGTLCTNAPVDETATWEGKETPVKQVGTCVVNGPLSPDGTRVGARISSNGNCGVSAVSLVNLSGGIEATPATGSPQGWLDGTHLVVGSADGGQPEAAGTIYDTQARTTRPIQAAGFFGAALPGGL